MTLTDMALLFLLFLLGYAIWSHLDVTRIAQYAAKKYCDKTGVQFLDQNVVLRKISLARSPHSLFAFKRLYRFEFASIGDRRYRGTITLIGQRMLDVELEPYKTAEALSSE
ncbi:MAG: DUF3301 domain-containing protein [Cellvibrionaceae bacterium]